ncbi:unnamed protein product [Darwinula stevensoni]|uniref:SAM domain-containing protein n=1 Tax=Darwinula stevensoni TaxID=69355 RepID=A0A7R8X479_9CRUS|nr:unnamed protein product [Darwinula stevensoni]CAG0883354.1 unnamed protein product [Darwinula stevensoni]
MLSSLLGSEEGGHRRYLKVPTPLLLFQHPDTDDTKCQYLMVKRASMELKCSADNLLNSSEEPDVYRYEEKSISALSGGAERGERGEAGEVPEITLSIPSPEEKEEAERKATRRVQIAPESFLVPPGSPQVPRESRLRAARQLGPRSHSFSHAPRSPPPTTKAGGISTRRISHLAVPGLRRDMRDRSRSPDQPVSGAAAGVIRRKLPIINPFVQLPMWPNISGNSGGLISKVLLANADALCASALPLMGVDDFSMEGFEEKTVMSNYFGIGIDAKITLAFHRKREEHPEKCRSRTRNFMWYGVLGSKEMLQKTYKNLEQRVHLECDGQRIPLPSLQGIVILNIPSFMGGTNFWGGSKADEVFLAPSLDDRLLEVVAVFGTTHMAASRLIKLQHHRIAQCSNVKISIFGGEGLPVEVDGEAWIQSPGIIRIVHKNRAQMLCRNRQLETSLKSWQEKQQRGSVSHKLAVNPIPLSDDELQLLANLLEDAMSLVRIVKVSAVETPLIGQELLSLAHQSSHLINKTCPGGKMAEGPALRLAASELVAALRELQDGTNTFLREKAPSANLNVETESRLHSALAHVEKDLRRCVDRDGTVSFICDDDHLMDRKRGSRGFLRGLLQRKSTVLPPGGIAGLGSGTREPAPRDWGLDEVEQWLERLDMAEYREKFRTHDIRGSEVLHLDRRDLKELGITKIGHIKRLQQGIKDLKALDKQSGK